MWRLKTHLTKYILASAQNSASVHRHSDIINMESMLCLFCLIYLPVLSSLFDLRIIHILEGNIVQHACDFHLFGVGKCCISDNYTKEKWTAIWGLIWHFCTDQPTITYIYFHFTQLLYWCWYSRGELYFVLTILLVSFIFEIFWYATAVDQWLSWDLLWFRSINICHSWNWPDRHTTEKC